MIPQIVKMMTTVFQASPAPIQEVKSAPLTENPFASPFIAENRDNIFRGRNQPVPGGIFFGYHNGKRNIVGKNLFVSV